jgi:hypothetical protein
MLYCDSDLMENHEILVTEAENVRLEDEEPNRTRRYSYGSGWGMFVTPNDEDRAAQVRNAWLTMTETPSYSYGTSTHTKKHSTSQVLFSWRNPSPSVSIKHLSNNGNIPSESMELSCYIDGFRIVQYSNGEIKAEFCLSFSYGSMSYLSWKSYTEFKEYCQTIHLIHHNIKPMFPNTLQDWEALRSRKKWYRCLSVPYLKEKSILIGRVVQSSLLESPTPGLLLEFLRHSKTKA